MKAVYYKLGSYELGLMPISKKSSMYFCWCEIYDENKKVIKNHSLSDRFTGKWPKCNSLLNKWRTNCIKNKLTEK